MTMTTTQTLDTMNQQLRNSIDKLNTDTAQKIAEMHTYQAALMQRLLKLHNLLPTLESTLANLGLGIASISYFKTGESCELPVWKEGNKLSVHITAIPISKKFKFLTFNGYTARGDGKNSAKLREKAARLQDTIKAATQLEQVQVNMNSLEVRNAGDTKQVLITLWVA